jgi:regulatory protein
MPDDVSDELQESPDSPDESRVTPRNKALDLLSRREHSRLELRTKLAAREYSSAEIEPTLDVLVADGLLSDERFAEAYFTARKRVGRGPVRIRLELEQRGVNSGIIHQYLDEYAVEWLSLAKDVRRRKFGSELPLEYQEKARQMRFLEQRGFTHEQIRAAVDDNRD